MKILHIEAYNFGSYRELKLDIKEGLTLVEGPTGSGKSTLLDLATWCLYGITAKNGNADEVRSWGTEEPTTVYIDLQLGTEVIQVVRIRGEARQNDLFWFEHQIANSGFRGKDINDTQTQLSARLGTGADQFIASCYFHEFSPIGSFFSATAKDRRLVLENIANTELPARLNDAASANKKEKSKTLKEYINRQNNISGQKLVLANSLVDLKAATSKWRNDSTNAAEKERLRRAPLLDKQKKYEDEAVFLYTQGRTAAATKLELEVLDKEISIKLSQTCEACGGKVVTADIKYLQQKREPLVKEVAKNIRDTQRYTELLQVLETLRHQLNATSSAVPQQNPYEAQLKKIDDAYSVAAKAHVDNESAIAAVKQDISRLEALQDLSGQLRGVLLTAAVQHIESSTNNIIDSYFDGELKVAFSLNGADKLEVQVQKSGHECVYRQLSKGQRQILKLAFTVSVMGASANQSGIHFDTLFFDEALDGLDSNLKVKAYRLFERLATKHASVFMVEHDPEFKELFNQKYSVILNGDSSELSNE